MGDYVIVSDATLDLPASLIEEYGIHVIPMGVNIDQTNFNHYPDEESYPLKNFMGS